LQGSLSPQLGGSEQERNHKPMRVNLFANARTARLATGMLDAVVFRRPIPGPKCGAEIRSHQTPLSSTARLRRQSNRSRSRLRGRRIQPIRVFLRSRPKQRGMHAASPSSQESEEGALRASCARSVPCAICDDGGQQPVVGGRGTRPGRSGRWTSSPRVGQGMSSLGMICSYDPGGTLLPYKGRLWIISM